MYVYNKFNIQQHVFLTFFFFFLLLLLWLSSFYGFILKLSLMWGSQVDIVSYIYLTRKLKVSWILWFVTADVS